MFESYLPQRFCREYVEVKGDSSQLVNFMATVLGHKPLMDDWVQAERLNDFVAVCTRYGLHVDTESIFIPVDKPRLPETVIGRDNLTSTSAYGVPADARPPGDVENGWTEYDGRVHLFMSRDETRLRHGMWYPLVIRNRIFWPPRADLLSYGRHLGYPPCCIAFFRRYNDWTRYSFLQEIRRNSAVLHPWCNPLGKDRTYSYIYHMPCSFACVETVSRVGRLRADIAAREPDFVRTLDRHLSIPSLVLRERKLYFFKGTVHGQRIDYTEAIYEGSEAMGDVLGHALRRGNAVEVDEQRVRVLRGTEILYEITCTATGFAPEVPFVIAFPALKP